MSRINNLTLSNLDDLEKLKQAVQNLIQIVNELYEEIDKIKDEIKEVQNNE